MKFISVLLKLFAALLMVLVVVFLPLSLIARGVSNLLFQPEIAAQLIEEKVLDEEFLSGIVKELVLTQTSQSDDNAEGAEVSQYISGALSELDDDQWSELIQLVVPKESISALFSDVITSISQWLDSDEILPSLEIDLTEIKSNYISNSKPILNLVLGNLPECTSEQIASYALNELGEIFGSPNNSALPLCKPPEPSFSALIDKGASSIPQLISRFPDKINPLETMSTMESANLVKAKNTLLTTRFIMRASLVFVLAIFAVGLLAASRSWSEFFRWAGWPLLLSGLFSFLLLSIINLAIYQGFNNTDLTGSSIALQGLLQTLVSSFAEMITQPFQTQAVALSATGLMSLFISSLIKKQKSHSL